MEQEDKLKKLFGLIQSDEVLGKGYKGVNYDDFKKLAAENVEFRDALHKEVTSRSIIDPAMPFADFDKKTRDYALGVQPQAPQPPPISLAPTQQQARPVGVLAPPSLTERTAQQAVQPMPEQPVFQPFVQFKNEAELQQSAKSPVFKDFGAASAVMADREQMDESNPLTWRQDQQTGKFGVFEKNDFDSERPLATFDTKQQADAAIRTRNADNEGLIMPFKDAEADFAKMSPEQQKEAIQGSTGSALAESKKPKPNVFQKAVSYGKDLVKSVERGLARGKAANVAKPTNLFNGTASDAEIDEIARINREIKQIGGTAVEQDFSKHEGVWDTITDWIKIAPPTLIESMAMLGRSGYDEIAAGTAVGAGTGSVVPVIGTAAGAATGFTAGSIAAGAGVEFFSSFFGELEKMGVDTGNPQAIKAALKNPEILSKARKTAAIRAGVIGGGSALVGAAASGLRPIASGLTQAAGEFGVELGAQAASGQDINLEEAGLEAIGELPVSAITAKGLQAARKAAPTQLGGMQTQTAPQPTKRQNKDGSITVTVGSKAEIPEQYQDRARKGMTGTATTLPFGLGKKTNIEQWSYNITPEEDQIQDVEYETLAPTEIPPAPESTTEYVTVSPEELQAFQQGQIDPERAAAIADDVALIQSGQMDINSIDDANYRVMVESALGAGPTQDTGVDGGGVEVEQKTQEQKSSEWDLEVESSDPKRINDWLLNNAEEGDKFLHDDGQYFVVTRVNTRKNGKKYVEMEIVDPEIEGILGVHIIEETETGSKESNKFSQSKTPSFKYGFTDKDGNRQIATAKYVGKQANEEAPVADQAQQNLAPEANQPVEAGAAPVATGEPGRPVVEGEDVSADVVEEEGVKKPNIVIEEKEAPKPKEPFIPKQKLDKIKSQVKKGGNVLLRTGKIEGKNTGFFAIPEQGGPFVDDSFNDLGVNQETSAYTMPNDFKVKDLSNMVFDDYKKNKEDEKAKAEGYDGVKIMEMDGTTVMDVVNPKKLIKLDESLPELRNEKLQKVSSQTRKGESGQGSQQGVKKSQKGKRGRSINVQAALNVLLPNNKEAAVLQTILENPLSEDILQSIFGGPDLQAKSGRKSIKGERSARIGMLKKNGVKSVGKMAEMAASKLAEWDGDPEAMPNDFSDGLEDLVIQTILNYNSKESIAKELLAMANLEQQQFDEQWYQGQENEDLIRESEGIVDALTDEEFAQLLGANEKDVAEFLQNWDEERGESQKSPEQKEAEKIVQEAKQKVSDAEKALKQAKNAASQSLNIPLGEKTPLGLIIGRGNLDAKRKVRVAETSLELAKSDLAKAESQLDKLKGKKTSQLEIDTKPKESTTITETTPKKEKKAQEPKTPLSESTDKMKLENQEKVVGEGATILPSVDADKAEARLYILQKNNYYTLWYERIRKTPDGNTITSTSYLTILSQDIDDARTKALDYLNKMASGEFLSVAFAGKNIQDLRGAKTIALQENILTTQPIVKTKTLGVEKNFGIGKYSSLTIDELLDKDPSYAQWFVNNYTSRGADQTKAIIKGDPRYQDYINIKRDIEELEKARIEAYEAREAERKTGKAVPVATLVRGEEGDIKEVIEETAAPKKEVQKQERRIVKNQITDIIPPQSKAADKVAPVLKPQMFDAQVDGANTAIASMDKYGVVLNGDGAGVGKTRQIVAVAKHYADSGKPVIIISENAALGKPFEGGKKPTLGGSMAKDSEAMGVPLTLLTDNEKVTAGGIYVSTYNRVKEGDVPAGAIIIFDESHNLVNTFGRTPNSEEMEEERQWEAKFRPMLKKAGAVAYYSATPADKPHQLAYLYKALGFNTPENFLSEMMANGAVIKERKFGKTKIKYYDVPNSKARRADLYKWVNGLMVKAGEEGRFIKREISYEGTDVQFHDIKGTDESKNQYAKEFNKVLDDMSDAEQMDYRLLAPNSYILYAAELAKIGDAVNIIKKQLAQGRKSIIFVSRINPMEIRGRRQQFDGELGSPEVLGEIPSPVPMLEEALKKEGIKFVGLHSKAKTTSQKAQKQFAEEADVLIASLESGGTGINLDDTVGNNPRTEVFLFSPYRGISTIQGMGRIWRASTIQNDNNPNRYVFVTASDIAPDLKRSGVLAKKLQLMNAAIGGTAVSKLPMSKVSYSSEELVGIELPDDTDEESAIFKEKTGILKPVDIDWKQSRKGGYYADASANLLEWMERGGPDRTGLDVRVFKGEDGKWIALAGKDYKADEFAPETIIDESDPQAISAQPADPFATFDTKGEEGQQSRTKLKQEVGPEMFKQMQLAHKNAEKILRSFPESFKIDCP